VSEKENSEQLLLDLAQMVDAKPKQDIADWLASNVYFDAGYPGMAEGPFDPYLTPFYVEPMRRIVDRVTTEIWFIKPPQGAGSECLILGPMRYKICEDPGDILYVSGEMESTKEFFEERIKPALQQSEELRNRWHDARKRGLMIYYPDMMLGVAWSESQRAVKQKAFDLVLGDEVATWKSFVSNKLRGRLGTRAYGKIVGISSLEPAFPGPTEEQVIYQEFLDTGQCKYFLPDPRFRNRKNKRWFTLRMRIKDRKTGMRPADGLSWDQSAKRIDGTWDRAAVEESAVYVTPWGTEIDDEMLPELLMEGEWRETVQGADPTKWGGLINELYLPWRHWGTIAKEWVTACEKLKRDGDDSALKTMIVEKLAEVWYGTREKIDDDIIDERRGEYARGQRFSLSDGQCAGDSGQTLKEYYAPYLVLDEKGKDQRLVLTTVDVQKDYGYYLSREWCKNGDSGLIEWGLWHTWEEVNDAANRVNSNRVLVDSGYSERQQEVYEACHKYNFIPVHGNETIKQLLFYEQMINPFEGTRQQAKTRAGKRLQIRYIQFRTIPFKKQLLQRIAGKTPFRWYVYNDIEREYKLQVTSEEIQDDKVKLLRRDNHLWDCECYQLLGATRWGYSRFRGYETLPGTEGEESGDEAENET
jgi:hypothetical protein